MVGVFLWDASGVVGVFWHSATKEVGNMYVRGNIIGFLFTAMGALVGFVGVAVLRSVALGCVVGGLVMFVLDLMYRTSRTERSLVHPHQGGNLFFLPVWLIGLGVAGYGLITASGVTGGAVIARPSAIPSVAIVAPTSVAIVAPTSVDPTHTPTETPTPMTLWVCVDLAYGYSQPSIQSTHVWQMSQRDGWKVTGPSSSDAWMYITLDDGRSAYMMRSDFCTTRPMIQFETPQPPTLPENFWDIPGFGSTPVPFSTLVPPSPQPPTLPEHFWERTDWSTPVWTETPVEERH